MVEPCRGCITLQLLLRYLLLRYLLLLLILLLLLLLARAGWRLLPAAAVLLMPLHLLLPLLLQLQYPLQIPHNQLGNVFVAPVIGVNPVLLQRTRRDKQADWQLIDLWAMPLARLQGGLAGRISSWQPCREGWVKLWCERCQQWLRTWSHCWGLKPSAPCCISRNTTLQAAGTRG